jgi:hypothetical protein
MWNKIPAAKQPLAHSDLGINESLSQWDDEVPLLGLMRVASASTNFAWGSTLHLFASVLIVANGHAGCCSEIWTEAKKINRHYAKTGASVMNHYISRNVIGCLLLMTLSWASPLKAGEAYFLLMFSSQSTPVIPKETHSFATFVRAKWDGNGPCPLNAKYEKYTISWLPANRKVRTIALSAEPGHNFDLDESISIARNNHQRVSAWGPYEIKAELFERALARKTELEKGNIKYKAMNGGNRNPQVVNCIHAISGLVERPGPHLPLHGLGDAASYDLLNELEPWIISKSPEAKRRQALGLDHYQIIYRDWEGVSAERGTSLPPAGPPK